MAQESATRQTTDFSMVLGGPLFQTYCKAHLSGSALELLGRRIVVISLFAWLPLLILSIVDGDAVRGVRVPFLYDYEAYARFLVAMPALIGAELVVHRRISPVVHRFVERRIVAGDDIPRLQAAVDATLRVRNSVWAELALLALVYTFGFWFGRNQILQGPATWYARPEAGQLHLTPAGYWYRLVSVPILQFLLLRWYLRLALWFRLLWKISRLDLHLIPAHPDRSGGIGFLGSTSYAFGPVLFAQGALLAGRIASRVLFQGQDLLAFKVEAVGLILAMVLGLLGPLMMFAPRMEKAKRQGTAEYGLLASQYVHRFEEKWMGRGGPDMSELLGSADIQSLADLGNSYGVVREMRWVPFGVMDISRLAITTAAPLLPLVLTVVSLDELVTKLVKVVF